MKTKIKIFSLIFLIMILVFSTNSSIFANDSVDDLNDQISQVKDKLEDLQKQASVYQKNIRIKQEESISLKNQLEIIENQIAKTEIDIETTQEEANKTALEIRATELNIITQQEKIEKQKKSLSKIINEIHKNDETNLLEIFVLNDSISDFFSQLENTKSLSEDLNNSLGDIKEEKQLLVQEKQDMEAKRDELVKLKKQLESDKNELDAQLVFKEDLLIDTKNSEQLFYNLYWQAKQEQDQANNDIYALEKAMRQRLDEQKADQPQLTDSTLIWPVPKNKVTAYFHDPDYPFRYLFEHPAIDVRAGQGTTLRAAADGYVLKAKDAGMGYSYISIIHANGLSTVYGHVSAIYVKEDEYVSKGEVIGLTGGMPGTPGAGSLCTGPHLHFEVRLNGIPVDPLLYLP